MNAITLSGVAQATVTIEPSFYAERSSALAEAETVQAVTNPLAQRFAVESLRSLQALAKQVEDSRKAIKAPVLDLGKKIDATAETAVEKINAEVTRIKGLLNAYEAEQRRIAAEAEAKRQAEERERQRIEAERLAAIERERQAAEKAQREAEAAARNAATAEARAKAQAEAQAARDAQRIADMKRQAEEEAARVAAATALQSQPVANKPDGMRVSTPWTFDVEDIAALYKARPDLCNVTPKRAEILTIIRAGTREIPGLKIRQEVNVSAR